MRRIELDEFYEFDKQISEELKNNEMKTILQPTKEDLKKAEQKFNRLHNKFYTALSILHDVMSEMPQKGNTAEECQKVTLICAINDLEAKLNGVCIDDFLINDK